MCTDCLIEEAVPRKLRAWHACFLRSEASAASNVSLVLLGAPSEASRETQEQPWAVVLVMVWQVTSPRWGANGLVFSHIHSPGCDLRPSSDHQD